MSVSLRVSGGVFDSLKATPVCFAALLAAALLPQSGTAADFRTCAANPRLFSVSNSKPHEKDELRNGSKTLHLFGSNNHQRSAAGLRSSSKSLALLALYSPHATLPDTRLDGSAEGFQTNFNPFSSIRGQAKTVLVNGGTNDLFGFLITTSDNQSGSGVLTTAGLSASISGSNWLFILFVTATAVLARRRSLRLVCIPVSESVVWMVAAALFAATIPMNAQSQVDYSGTNITGQMSLVRVVNLRAKAQSVGLLNFATGTQAEVLKAPPPRLRPPDTRSLSTLSLAAPVPKSMTITGAGTVVGFNALSHLDQRNANNGNQFSIEPPSQSIAVANGFVLEGVNNAVQVYNTSGTPALPVVLSTNQVFGVPAAIDRTTGVNGVYLTDMRVYFEKDIGRWFIIQRTQDNDAHGNPLPQTHLYMAVSRTTDPTGDYLIYLMDTTNASHPGCPCIPDFPQIGSDQYGFYITWNEFNSFSQTFIDASLMSMSKSALAQGQASPTAYQFLVPFTTGYEFAIQPAAAPPGASDFLAAGGVEYLVSSLSRSGSGSSMALWAIRNTSSLATPNPNLVLSRSVTPTLPYLFPDVATQRPGPLEYGSTIGGTLAFLDGGDSRILSVSYAGGRLYLTLQTAVRDESNRFVVAGAFVVLSPVFRSNVLSAQVVNQGYLMVNGNHLLRPAVAVNAQGVGSIAVTLVGAGYFPSAAVIPLPAVGAPTTVRVAAAGVLPEDGFTGYAAGVARWGDYNGAVAAADGSIWMVAQYIGNYPRTVFANWNTYVMQVRP
jgi:hypothetical protein